MRVALATIAVVALLPEMALAGSGDRSARAGTARALAVRPIVLTHTAGRAIVFGRFTSGTLGGTINITSGGTVTRTGEVNFVTGSTTRTDAFSVSGDPGRAFGIVTTSGTVVSGARSMAFTTAPSASRTTIAANGRRTFSVGGRLTVAGNQGVGSYTGTYLATVTYN
ncbi:DUF4402 domain-containing protein [Novosphingobium cyanobacteriorum]|uniref:DUF4402 domain-containing protein n=1 Tax=Novosphingobium cyanobacteriorum TaxID=3024215 RepID=A0ABT6CL16_9SPHN|nr:DUF4402 domain-containing protein [Novosphingobium cyanobacteriorum]MDF8334619.1 DUF4402 domain-containing protein [Novosphingobium cyanobacteriorum]